MAIEGLCPHHEHVLTSWRSKMPHEPEEEFTLRVAQYADSCGECLGPPLSHPPTSRDLRDDVVVGDLSESSRQAAGNPPRSE